jgi:hypothetical protein
VDQRVLRAAEPGDILDLYMIGLGATSDPAKFITNQVFAEAYPVGTNVTAKVGGENAPVLFAGLTSPGLYLVRIAIPTDLAAGPQPILISAGGAQTRSLSLILTAVPTNLIQDGSFKLPCAGNWQASVDASTGAAGTIQRMSSTAADGTYSAQIDVATPARHTSTTSPCLSCAVQFWQTGLSITQGTVYTQTFWAKTDAAYAIPFQISQSGPTSYNNEGLQTTAYPDGDWLPFTFYFQATATDPNARLTFYFGNLRGKVWLDSTALHP